MYSEIVNVQISLETSAVSRAGFGTPLIISDNVWFKERVRAYTSFEGAAEDFPTTSKEYAALQSVFSRGVDPATVKIGRREVDSITFTADAATAIGQVYTIEVLDTADATTTATFVTTTGSETPTDIATALVAAIGAPAGVTVVDDTGSLTLSKSGTDPYAVTDVTSNISYVATTTEAPADTVNEIVSIDNDFYFVASTDHTQTFVLNLSTDIEAREKLYFVSTQEQDCIDTAYSPTATDTASQLAQNNRFRTSYWFHHDADTVFPEMEYITVGAPFDPGKAIWANERVSSEAAKDPLTGKLLSTTQKTNLVNKYANFTEIVGGLTITRRGQVSGNEWIDVIRNRDFLVARITEAYQNFLINSKVVPYTDIGIARTQTVLSSTLNRYVETEAQPNILQAKNPYIINFPRRKDVSFGDVAARVFNGAFTAYLAGALQVVEISGSLNYSAES